MGQLSGFRYLQIARKPSACGFLSDRPAPGSYEICFNPQTNRYTTLANHPGDIPEGTLRAILKQVGVDQDLFLNS